MPRRRKQVQASIANLQKARKVQQRRVQADRREAEDVKKTAEQKAHEAQRHMWQTFEDITTAT